jgi:hypothetical protein
MALASTTAENQALNALDASGSPTNIMAYVSLHTASPSTTGANENAATGSYTRQACSWNAASGGSKTNSASGTSGGTYGIGGALASSVTATTITIAAGALTLSAS